MNPEQLQYACDLINADTSADERMDAARCKVGKPCNGRCIPKSSKCSGEGDAVKSSLGNSDYDYDPDDRSSDHYKQKKQAAFKKKAVVGLVLAGAAGAIAHHQIQKAGGYGVVGKNAANTGLNVAEGTIGGANAVVQEAGHQAKRGVNHVYGTIKNNVSTKEAKDLNHKVATVALNGIAATKRASSTASFNGKAYVRALRRKLNK